MNDFLYYCPVRVHFGTNILQKALPMELTHMGKNVMLAYGGGSVKRSGLYDTLVLALEQAGKKVIDFGGIMSNPTYAKVLEGVEVVKQEKVDFILAVGGGSVMDCAKVIAAAAKAPKDLWEMVMVDHQLQREGIAWGAVVTLSGTGSEMDNGAGITNEALKRKGNLPGTYAEFAVLDPTYLLTVPKKQLMACAFDNLSHCMETYFGRGTGVMDRMNEALMHDIVENIRAYLKDPSNLEILGNLMWDSSLVQTFLFNMGKPGDFQCHAIEHQICAYTNCNHGMTLAVIHPSYYRHIVYDAPEKFARFGKAVFDLDPAGKTETEQALKAVETLTDFIKEIGLDSTFTGEGLDINEEILHKVADTCGLSGGNVRKLDREEVFELLKEVL